MRHPPGGTRKAYVSHDSKAFRTWVQFPPPPPSFVALNLVPSVGIERAAGQRSTLAEGRLARRVCGFRSSDTCGERTQIIEPNTKEADLMARLQMCPSDGHHSTSRIAYFQHCSLGTPPWADSTYTWWLRLGSRSAGRVQKTLPMLASTIMFR